MRGLEGKMGDMQQVVKSRSQTNEDLSLCTKRTRFSCFANYDLEILSQIPCYQGPGLTLQGICSPVNLCYGTRYQLSKWAHDFLALTSERWDEKGGVCSVWLSVNMKELCRKAHFTMGQPSPRQLNVWFFQKVKDMQQRVEKLVNYKTCKVEMQCFWKEKVTHFEKNTFLPLKIPPKFNKNTRKKTKYGHSFSCIWGFNLSHFIICNSK